MAKVRQVLSHVQVDVAARQRICHRARNKHQIYKGESCLVIKEGATLGHKNYCLDCATAILELAQTDLSRLKESLEID